MNLSYFISKRITKGQPGAFSSTIHKIAVASVGIGLAIMIVSFLILFGFQDTVKGKIFSFASHIQVTKYTLNNSFEEDPISINTDFYKNPDKYDVVKHVQEYSHKAGLMKSGDEVLGVVFKGVGRSFDVDGFSENLVEGRFVNFLDSTYSKEIMVSKSIANKLELELENEIVVHFFQDPPRSRKLKIVGIYDTNLSEYFDDKFIIGDIGLIRRLNNWPDTLAGGIEVFVKDFNNIDGVVDELEKALDYDLYVEKVSDKYIQVFDWLELIKRQVNIFLGLILFVVCFNMVSIVLIMIMERTRMIGMLKALGAEDWRIRGVFGYSGMWLIAKGLLIGNSIGLGLCALQYHFKLIPLNPVDYYMSFVPISWSWETVLVLNALTFLVVLLILVIPTVAISRIHPIKSIQFD